MRDTVIVELVYIVVDGLVKIFSKKKCDARKKKRAERKRLRILRRNNED